MRSDMTKVLVERPRHGARLKDPSGYKRDIARAGENPPNKESMRKKWKKGYAGKDFSDLIGPIRRYLHSQVGRPWDKVWSDICQSDKSKLSHHFRRHFMDFVELHVIVEDKKIYFKDDRWGRSELRGEDLYVHPVSGLLCKYARKKEVYKHKPQFEIKWTGELIACVKVEDVWYECQFLEASSEYIKRTAGVHEWWQERTFNDILLKDKWASPNQLYKAYGKSVCCVSKRQMNSKEIKRAIRD